MFPGASRLPLGVHSSQAVPTGRLPFPAAVSKRTGLRVRTCVPAPLRVWLGRVGAVSSLPGAAARLSKAAAPSTFLPAVRGLRLPHIPPQHVPFSIFIAVVLVGAPGTALRV